MGAITNTSTIRDVVPAQGMKILGVKTPATANTGDTVVITLGSYGIATDGIVAVVENIHTTEDSVLEHTGITSAGATASTGFDNSTTAVSSGVLTITIGTGTAKAHGFLIVGIGDA